MSLKLNYGYIKFYGQLEEADVAIDDDEEGVESEERKEGHPAGAELNFVHLTLDTLAAV